MQRNSCSLYFLILPLILFTQTLSAQIVGANCFLQGDFVEVGINQCGAYGSSALPPAGYHANPGLPGLGFVADWESDGWDTGTPDYCGDYFVPGSPVEGWQVQIGADVWTNTDQSCFTSDIPGSVTDYSFAAGIYTGTWEGNITTGSTDLDITQITTLPEDKLYFVTRILLCNNGDEPLNDVYYKRNVDPDNDQPWSGDFTTNNIIVYQPPLDPEALVTSEGLTYGCFLGIGARDENARVSYGLFATDAGTPQDVWDATGGYSGSGSEVGDIANSIAFYIPTINPGECKCVAFAYILNADDLEEALEATVTFNLTVDATTIASGDTVASCFPGDEVDITIVGADDYFWTWTPSIGLDTDTGINVIAIVDSTTTFTAVGVGGFCGDATLTITVLVDSLEVAADAGNDTTVCLGDVVFLNGNGGEYEDQYEWDPPANLDCFDCEDPQFLPVSSGSYTLTLNTIDTWNCPSTDDVVITVNALPVVDAGDDQNLCPEGSIQLLATGAVDYIWAPSTGLSCTNCPDPICTVNDNTTYTVTGTDANGCINTDEIEISVFSTLDIIVTAVPNDTIDGFEGENTQLFVTGAVDYTWTPSTGLSAVNIANPFAQPETTTTYIVTGIDDNGCIDVDTITIYVVGEIHLPTAFSPNGDGINDIWAPIYSGSGVIEEYNIYNRWGQIVYSGNGNTGGWDGKLDGNEQEMGTFTVLVRGVSSANVPRIITGNFILVR